MIQTPNYQSMRIFTFLLIVLIPLFAFSQADESLSLVSKNPATISMVGVLGLPGADLRQADYARGGGMQMKVLSKRLNPSNTLLNYRFGMATDVIMHGVREPRIDISSENAYTASVENCQFGVFATARLETTPLFPVQLYADGLVGTRGFVGSWSRHFGADDNCVETSSGHNSSWHLSYGLTVGSQIKLGRHSRLDIGATYMTVFGTPEFIDLNTVELSVKDLSYEMRSAAAQQWNLHIGINFDVIPSRRGSRCGNNDFFFDGGSCSSSSSCR